MQIRWTKTFFVLEYTFIWYLLPSTVRYKCIIVLQKVL